MKKTVEVVISIVVASFFFIGCTKKASYKINKALSSTEHVRLNIVGSSSSFKSVEDAAISFSELYPNVTVEYEYLQNYKKLLLTRLDTNDNVDLFITTNILDDSPYLPYSLELKSQSDALNLSSTFEGFIRNFTITQDGRNELYAVPFGGEIRGLFVNKTLLASLGLSVPNNYSEFMSCCKKLKDAGFVPIQGNPGNTAQQLMYPYICNIIVNGGDYKNTYKKINDCEPGISELFREPLNRLYEIVASGYYNYKYVENTKGLFLDNISYTTVTNFLNIVQDKNGNYVKLDDIGQVAFLPTIMSLKNQIDKAKEDYHSNIEYEFILAPVGDDGGYAYLSPAEGLAINKKGANTKWALEFMNYLFSKDVNKKIAAGQNIIPNTTDAMEEVNSLFKIKPNQESELGQVSFDYGFYGIITKTLLDISKANNPKYMETEDKMYSFDYYMTELEKNFVEQKNKKEIGEK